MTVLHRLPVTPDEQTMRSFAHRLFNCLGARGRVELAWTSPHYPHKLSGARLFAIDEIDELVDLAVKHNETHNRNVYIGPALKTTECAVDRRTEDRDAALAVACWADCDREGSLTAALDIAARMRLTPNIVTFTGREPYLRGQLFWLLDEATEDLTLVRQINEAFVARLGSDSKVVNIGRVMRLPGGVAWPLKEGRVLEMTGLLDVETRAAPYTLDELRAQLERAGVMAAPKEQGAKILDFSRAALVLDLDDLIARAAEPGQWHGAALAATAHLLGRGAPPDVVLDVLTGRLQQPGYTYADTRNDLRTLVEGALKRGIYREAAPRGEEEVFPGDLPSAPCPFLSIEDLLALPPPDWLVRDYLIEQGMSVMFGPPASFKSFVALDLALSVAYGRAWHGFPVKDARPVLYICAEGQYGFGARGLVWRQHRAESAACAGFHVLPVPVNFLDPKCVDKLIASIEVFNVGARFVVIDTLARNFGSGDENSTKDMSAFIAGIDRLRQAMKAHVLVVHHSGKDDAKDERGSSALRGAADATFRLSRDEGSDRVLLNVRKQKDGPEASPMSLLCVLAEAVHPITGEVVTSRIPTMDDSSVNPAEGARTSNKIGRNERLILEALEDGPSAFGTLKRRLGVDDGNLARALKSLLTKNYVHKHMNFYVLASGGPNDSTVVLQGDENT